MPAQISGATLERNAILAKKHKFYCVFLKVTSPLMGNLLQLVGGTLRAGSGGSTPAHYQNRQNPYSWQLFGEFPYSTHVINFESIEAINDIDGLATLNYGVLASHI